MQGLACAIAALLPTPAERGSLWEPRANRTSTGQPRRIAVISVHGCPLLPAGGRDIGGMNVYIRELSRELGDRGLTIDIYVRWHDQHEPDITELAPNVRVIHLDAGPRGPLPKENLYPILSEFLRNLQAFRREHGLTYDLIHSHYWLSGWVGNALHRSWRVPHITMFHTMGEVKNRARAEEKEPALRVRTERRIVGRADRIVAPSPQEASEAMQAYGALPSRIAVIPCGVDLEIFRPLDESDARRALGLPEGPLALFVGRLEPLKGLDVVIEALPQMREPVQLVVVGGDEQGDPELLRLRILASELGVADRVHFLGSEPHDRLRLYYNAADVLVVPSYYESFCMVALEAMACGTPVVAAQVGGLQSIVRDGETGFLIPERSHALYAARLDTLLGNSQLRANLGSASRRAAYAFGWSAIAGQVLALYDEVLKGAGVKALAS